jgi:hypothetical protein
MISVECRVGALDLDQKSAGQSPVAAVGSRIWWWKMAGLRLTLPLLNTSCLIRKTFTDNDYTDMQVEYAKNTPTDILIRLSLTNRSTHRQEIHALPTLWFRNTWSWKDRLDKPTLIKKGSPMCRP